MKYVTQIEEYHLQRHQVKGHLNKCPIILFLRRDNKGADERTSLNQQYDFIFALRTDLDFKPANPLILGIYNGTFGTMGPSMENDTFCQRSILETPLSNQLALYLIQELLLCRKGDMAYLENMIVSLGDYLVKRHNIQLEVNTNLKMGLSPFQVQRIQRYVLEHIDRPVQISELAMVADLSIHHFIRVFKKTTGETPHQFVMRLKLEEAKKLLLSTDESVIQVGMGVGCENPSHFSQLFKSNFGIPPLKFRKAFQASLQFAS
ncbi:helix-turn-helix domain-containing protein [Allomuricauda sp. NBRC 101325]|uniref:helix-turn-helix domain-containing protein n=1 Tax=Allomuricauda sp. NBRC 101325 TaxID=1113758 RepID=UPI0025522446|nr:AraC family transcriptional regulator [Muricauda sp. NBRC 101325]